MAKRDSITEPSDRVGRGPRIWLVLVVALLGGGWVCPARVGAAAGDFSAWDELTALSLEELMNVEVTLASRKEEKLFETAAAVWVITQEDLRRSGVTSIAEALRLVPGMQVGRIDANKWAVSARGFADRFAQKLLVLIDGRSVYNPLFSGVYWEVQDLVLEDVAQIEVIRGPGATLWGANAVNGIINIITRSARDTQGGLVTLGTGTEERGFGGVRYGGRLGEHGRYRVYAKGFARDGFVDAAGGPGNDDWQMGRGGFRGDWRLGAVSELTVQGDLFSGDAGQILRFPTLEPPFGRLVKDDTEVSGGNLLGRWQRSLGERGDLKLQLYGDWFARTDSLGDWEYEIYDADFQHRFAWGVRQEIVWGAGYRFSRDDTGASPKFRFDPDSDSRPAVQRFRAGRGRPGRRAAASDAGIEVRAQPVQRFRVSAERAAAVEATRRADGLALGHPRGAHAGARRCGRASPGGDVSHRRGAAGRSRGRASFGGRHSG